MRERRRAAKQRVHDKAVINHLTMPRRRPANPRPADRFDEENGRELMEPLKKRWTSSRTGGLPEF